MPNWGYLLVMLAYNLGLAFWIGGGLALGVISAPTLFSTLESRQTAGELFGRMLRKYSRARVAVIAIVLAAAAGKTLTWETSVNSWWLIARWTALTIMAGLLLLELLYIEKTMARLRVAGQASSGNAHFSRLHKLSETVMKASLIAAVVALLLG